MEATPRFGSTLKNPPDKEPLLSISWRIGLCAWIAVAIACYRPILHNLWVQWNFNSSYSHGPFVIPMVGWLLWRRWANRPRTDRPWPVGLAMLLIATTLIWVSKYFHIDAIGRWTLPLYALGFVGWSAGRAMCRWSLPAIGMMTFMIPMPFRMEQWIDGILGSASAWVSCSIVALAGIPSVTDGFSLWLPHGRLAITEDCSGFHLTLAMLAVIYFLTGFTSHRRQIRRWHLEMLRVIGWAMVGVTVCVLSNAIRISSMAIAVHHLNGSFADLVHNWGDWLVLPLAVVLFILAGRWIILFRPLSRAVSDRVTFPEFSSSPVSFWSRTLCEWRWKLAPLVAMLILAVTSVAVGKTIRQNLVSNEMARAERHCERGDWDAASACYARILPFHSDPDQVRLLNAAVMHRTASDIEDLRSVLLLVESVLQRQPFDRACLERALDVALQLDEPRTAAAATRKLLRLGNLSADREQMCIEAICRYPASLSDLVWSSPQQMNQHLGSVGPPANWRPSLITRLADYACRYQSSVDPDRLAEIESVIQVATDQQDSAEAHLICWKFCHGYGTSSPSPREALLRIDEHTPERVVTDIYLAMAEEAHANGRHDKAGAWLTKAIRFAPTDHRGHARFGRLLQQVPDREASAAAYLRAWRLSAGCPLEGESRVQLGIEVCDALVRNKQSDAASKLIGQIESSIEKSGRSPTADTRARMQLVKAEIAMSRRDFEDALTLLTSAEGFAKRCAPESLNESVDLQRTAALRAHCLIQTKRYADAARVFENRAATHSAPSDQWLAAARAWSRIGNIDDAARCYRNALQISRSDHASWLEYVSLLRIGRGRQEALAEIVRRSNAGATEFSNETLAQAWEIVGVTDRAVVLYDASMEGNRNAAALAIALARDGQTERALRIVREDRSLSPVERLHTIAMVGVSADDLSNVQAERITNLIQSATQRFSQDLNLVIAVGEWYLRIDDLEAATNAFEQALRIHPEHEVALNNLAMLLAERGQDCPRALECINRVIATRGEVPEFLDTKGWVLLRMRRNRDAIEFLRRAVTQSAAPSPIAELHLAAALLAVGNEDQAKQQWRIARLHQIESMPLNRSERAAMKRLVDRFAQSGHEGSDNGAQEQGA